MNDRGSPRATYLSITIVTVAAVLAGAGAGLSARPAAKTPGRSAVERGARPAFKSPCSQMPNERLTYHYPVKPFLRQHPIRGNFGDPRTLVREGELGADSRRTNGSFTFHNGVDISARAGTAVYPVVSGTARIGYADEVIVATGDGRIFQYFHIKPVIRPGQSVIAYRTVLGRVLREARHVHLTEIDGFRVHNPVDPGHLEPYKDHTVPEVLGLLFEDSAGEGIDPHTLHGHVLIAADAADEPPEAVPTPWLDYPVTPALVAWRLTTLSGATVIPTTTVADFRHTLPPNRQFWHVYAAGTYQNFPVFEHQYFFRQRGRYLFNLTPNGLDTRRLPDGHYILTVQVADVCGNRGQLAEQITIRNPADRRLHPDAVETRRRRRPSSLPPLPVTALG